MESYTYIETISGSVFKTSNVENWPNAVQLSKQEGEKRYLQQSADELRALLPEGSRVYCVLRSVSSSGMTRHIDFYAIKGDRPIWLSSQIAFLCGYRTAKTRGLIVRGCGMDMGFSVVCNLAYALYKSESALKHDWI